MKAIINLVSTIIIVVTMLACQQSKTEIITEKIQYDVNIKSPDADYDWWIQNLPGPQREKMVNMILDGALSGKYKAYNYYNQPISPVDVIMLMSDTTYYDIVDEEPPYEIRDTMVVSNIMREDVLRIRFLEEWRIDQDNLKMEKRILGIAPIARRPDLMGMERWQPLFWIYTDEKYVEELENNKKKGMPKGYSAVIL